MELAVIVFEREKRTEREREKLEEKLKEKEERRRIRYGFYED